MTFKIALREHQLVNLIWILTVSETNVITLSGRKRYKVGIQMGLHFGIHATHSHPMVQVRRKFVFKCTCTEMFTLQFKQFFFFFFLIQYYEFLGDCPLSVWNGSYDYVEDTA